MSSDYQMLEQLKHLREQALQQDVAPRFSAQKRIEDEVWALEHVLAKKKRLLQLLNEHPAIEEALTLFMG